MPSKVPGPFLKDSTTNLLNTLSFKIFSKDCFCNKSSMFSACTEAIMPTPQLHAYVTEFMSYCVPSSSVIIKLGDKERMPFSNPTFLEEKEILSAKLPMQPLLPKSISPLSSKINILKA